VTKVLSIQLEKIIKKQSDYIGRLNRRNNSSAHSQLWRHAVPANLPTPPLSQHFVPNENFVFNYGGERPVFGKP